MAQNNDDNNKTINLSEHEETRREMMPVVVVTFVFLAVLIVVGILLYSYNKKVMPKERSITQSKQEEVESNIKHCKLVSLKPFTYEVRNIEGKVTNTKIRYEVIYVDEEGNTHYNPNYDGDIMISDHNEYQMDYNDQPGDEHKDLVIVTSEYIAQVEAGITDNK